MKKILLLLVLAGMAVFALTACQQEDEVAANDAPAVAVVSTEDAAPVVEPTMDTVDTAEAQDTADVADVADATTNVAAATDEGTRGPILILGDAEFTRENGVVGGTGSVEDPYVIAGWEITVPAGEYYGVRIENVTAQFILRGLVITNATQMNGAGIRIGFASGGTIEGCSISNSMHGIDIASSTDLSIDNCVLYVSGRGLRVIGDSEEQYRHVISTNNQYNNLPIYYYYGLDGDTISGLRTAHLTIAGSRNVTVTNNEVVNGDGLQLAFVENSEITLNVAHRTANVITEHGILLYESHNNRVVGNGIKNNRLAGIQLTLSNGNTISDNEILVNDTGVRVLASDDNDIRSNLIYGDVAGVMLLGGSTGNTVFGNVIGDENDNMTQGIALEAAFSNTIEKNLIFGSEIGIMFEAQAS
ncbi:right-handed parallel beta-helix repeat-containing protein, partial [Candidatus Bipolaricaulota bacterium]|nr:right-handed parallel beta-helix repeat-containing protein [Candidatus Bipolaricaulota bacterium]